MLSAMLAGQALAQTQINNDGACPAAELLLIGDTLYGTAIHGGGSGRGTIFAVKADGTTFTTLHSFTGNNGMNPYAALTLFGDTWLYGTADCGGNTGEGTVFRLSTNGYGFVPAHHFSATAGAGATNQDGAEPYAALTLLGGTFYGTTEEGGTGGAGVVFTVRSDGTGFTNLHNFAASSLAGSNRINIDGAGPRSVLLLSSNILYGTTSAGGASGSGTVFAIGADGNGFSNLYTFGPRAADSAGIQTNRDGANSYAGLVLSADTLYGTTLVGGSAGNGTVFAIRTNGTGFRVLHSFAALVNQTNGDGAMPHAGLVVAGNTLYGTAQYGGLGGNGTVFAVNTDGTGFSALHSFSLLTFSGTVGTNNDGSYPYASLVVSSNTLYGTTLFGGTAGNGAVFALKTDGSEFQNLHSFSPLSATMPQLTVARSGTNVVLSWPVGDNPDLVYSLQSIYDLRASWYYVSYEAYPTNGHYVVTMPALAPQNFYRLNSQPLQINGCLYCPWDSMCVDGICYSTCRGLCRDGPGAF
jgi:uncharacterized repeat protein (TIGR03803 family)